MADPRILGPDGRPLDRQVLTTEIAEGGVMQLRQVWWDSIARGLTPAHLVSVLERAADGDLDDYLTLAEEMEERDPHYAAVLGVRKRAVSGLTPTVEAASDAASDVRMADAVREMTEAPAFGELLDDLLDALGKSYSVCEIVWQRGPMWMPVAYPHRDPRWFQFDRFDGRTLRLLGPEEPSNGRDLPLYKFVAHQPRLKTGLQFRCGLARLVAFCWICKAYALKDWLAFTEVFGMPLRLGRYGPSATPEDVRILKRAVQSIGSDAAAVLPESMTIEFTEPGNPAGAEQLYGQLCDWLDRQVSKAVLGQTMTTDAQSTGLGSNQANVHNEVRGDIQRADVRDLQVTLNRDLVRAFVDLNFGPQPRYPQLRLQIPQPEDLQQLTESLVKLVPLGLRVEESVVRDKFGLPDPDAGATLLAAPAAPAAPVADDPPAGRGARALNRASPVLSDAIDQLVDESLADWQEQLSEIVDPVEQLAADATDADDFMRRLAQLADTLEPAALIRGLAVAAYKARGLGDATDAP